LFPLFCVIGGYTHGYPYVNMIVCVFFLVVQKINADKKAHPHPQQTKKETKECGLAHGM
jgi:hypothetical protein